VNPNNIEYYIYRDGGWLLLHRYTNPSMSSTTFLPAVGTIMQFATEANDFQVTKVRFNLDANDVEIECVELYGTQA
jgi:hypothetical protein